MFQLPPRKIVRKPGKEGEEEGEIYNNRTANEVFKVKIMFKNIVGYTW